MTDGPVEAEEAITLSDLVIEHADDAIDALDSLHNIYERLLDLADPRVTPDVPDGVCEKLRELAGEIEDVGERATWRLNAISEAVRDVAPGAPGERR